MKKAIFTGGELGETFIGGGDPQEPVTHLGRMRAGRQLFEFFDLKSIVLGVSRHLSLGILRLRHTSLGNVQQLSKLIQCRARIHPRSSPPRLFRGSRVWARELHEVGQHPEQICHLEWLAEARPVGVLAW